MTTVPDVPANDNRSGIEDLIDDVAAALRRAVDAEVGAAASFGEREQAALRIANEATRRELLSALQDIVVAQGEADLLIDGQLLRRHQAGTVTYHSLVGPLAIDRPTFRQVGIHNGLTVVPLELAAGLMARATPALAYTAVLGHAKHHSRALHEDLLAAHRAPPSRTTLEKIGKRLGISVDEHASRIESYLRQICTRFATGRCCCACTSST
jgi:hypothetical protein